MSAFQKSAGFPELILEIPAQQATAGEKRLAKVRRVYEDGSVYLEMRDGKKPPTLLYRPGDVFPWTLFFKEVTNAWELSRQRMLPPEYRPLKRIPAEIAELLPALSESDAVKLLSGLREQGFLPPIPKFGIKQ